MSVRCVWLREQARTMAGGSAPRPVPPVVPCVLEHPVGCPCTHRLCRAETGPLGGWFVSPCDETESQISVLQQMENAEALRVSATSAHSPPSCSLSYDLEGSDPEGGSAPVSQRPCPCCPGAPAAKPRPRPTAENWSRDFQAPLRFMYLFKYFEGWGPHLVVLRVPSWQCSVDRMGCWGWVPAVPQFAPAPL